MQPMMLPVISAKPFRCYVWLQSIKAIAARDHKKSFFSSLELSRFG
jgi:hypothetical protein